MYLDNIKIVRYEHDYERLEDNLTVYDSISPITIFQDDLNGSWGVDINDCLNISTKKNQTGNSYIYIKTDSSYCDWLDFGISWNNWLYTDISRSIKTLNLVFEVDEDLADEFNDLSLEFEEDEACKS